MSYGRKETYKIPEHVQPSTTQTEIEDWLDLAADGSGDEEENEGSGIDDDNEQPMSLSGQNRVGTAFCDEEEIYLATCTK